MNPSSPELSDIAAMLEEHRARLTDPEREDIRRRATASHPSPARRSRALRGRAAITSMLAAGLVMTSGGAALGVSALSETRSARAAQYGTAAGNAGAGGVAGVVDSGSAAGGVGGATNSGSAGTLGGAASGENGVTPTSAAAGGSDRAAAGHSDDQPAVAQAPRQLESGDSELPFTGYLSGVVLLLGLGTLAAGLTLRRETRRAPTRA